MKPFASTSIAKKYQPRSQKGQVLSIFMLAIASFVSIAVVAGTTTPISTQNQAAPVALTGTAPPPVILKSVAAKDGWVLESSESSSVGGSVNATVGVIRLGDDARNRQYRGILSFDTSDLPDSATISSVVLRIRQDAPPVGGNPFNTLGNLWVDIQKGSFGAMALQTADFSTPASRQKVAFFDKTPYDGWITARVGPGGLMFVNKTGITQFRLYFGVDDNNNHLANYLTFYSGDATSATNQPVLEIRYYF